MTLLNWWKTRKYRRAERKQKRIDAKIQRGSIKAFNEMMHHQDA
jgi:hypothetical protein